MRRSTKGYLGFTVLGLTALCVWQVHARASDASGFPDGYDAFATHRDQGGQVNSRQRMVA
jgi:hypothetical protein